MKRYTNLILIGIVAGAVLGTLIGADIQVSRGLTGGGGFFAPWEGARAFLFQHLEQFGRWQQSDLTVGAEHEPLVAVNGRLVG